MCKANLRRLIFFNLFHYSWFIFYMANINTVTHWKFSKLLSDIWGGIRYAYLKWFAEKIFRQVILHACKCVGVLFLKIISKIKYPVNYHLEIFYIWIIEKLSNPSTRVILIEWFRQLNCWLISKQPAMLWFNAKCGNSKPCD